MLVSADEMRALEQAAFAAGTTADELMERAGEQIARAVRQFFPSPGTAEIFYGKGHNGGDALVAARHLAQSGWQINLHTPEKDREKLTELTRQKLAALKLADQSFAPDPHIVLDGLLGIGARLPLHAELREWTRAINDLRQNESASVVAIDIPTGLDADTGEADPDCVVADFTLAIGRAKKGLVADGATNFVGRLALLPLAELACASEGDELATAAQLSPLLPPRKFESHKNSFGHIAILAGSLGFTGAAALCSEGALRAGAGLVTLFVREEIQPTLTAITSPEIMVRPIESYAAILEEKFDVLAIGPGLGHAHAEEILHLIEKCKQPMIVDADALNAIARSEKMDLLLRCAAPRLLTPHPGEMARLFSIGTRTRREIVCDFVEKFPITLLLKGARTIIGERGKPLSYNTTGTPGMATGGMGDVLTGVCAALVGQKLSLFDAARLGAWLCGRAAELAIHNGTESEQSLAAMDVPRHIGQAFKQLRTNCF